MVSYRSGITAVRGTRGGTRRDERPAGTGETGNRAHRQPVSGYDTDPDPNRNHLQAPFPPGCFLTAVNDALHRLAVQLKQNEKCAPHMSAFSLGLVYKLRLGYDLTIWMCLTRKQGKFSFPSFMRESNKMYSNPIMLWQIDF